MIQNTVRSVSKPGPKGSLATQMNEFSNFGRSSSIPTAISGAGDSDNISKARRDIKF